MRSAAIPILAVVMLGCSRAHEPIANSMVPTIDVRAQQLDKQKDLVANFFKPMKIEEGDWLQTQTEAGETFEQYIKSNPTLPTVERRTIYIQPIGEFTAEQRKAIRLTAEYLKAFYNLPVKLNSHRKLGNVPADLKRESGYPKRIQIRTQHFLDDVLPKLLQNDAAALIAFTNYDLYPGDTWAFVFGKASLQGRVGVWSLYRLSAKASESDTENDRLLFRTLKIAMHETGHLFSMRHCTKYECLMSGTNHLAETDRRPLDSCPECMAKIVWATGNDPALRYNNLARFWKRLGRKVEARNFEQMAKAIEASER